MTNEVTDYRSNPEKQIKHAAEVIKKSAQRRKVFEAIYETKKKVKTVDEIASKTSLSRMRVLQEAGNLFNNSIISKTKQNGKLAYEKDKFYTQYKKKILSLAGNKDKLSKFLTKSNPLSSIVTIKVPLLKRQLNAKYITIDDIDSFSRTRKVQNVGKNTPILESVFKKGIQKIMLERGIFKDWGGEKNDLYTTRLLLKGKRKRVAFGFKGKSTKGTLTPAKMGVNGDQIQRLFENPADVFIVQYWDKIGESVIQQMEHSAMLKSYKEEREIFYSTIDGQDTLRILSGYPKEFSGSLSPKK